MQSRYQELSLAASVDEIIEITREYLATWTSDDFEWLPEGCKPDRVGSAEDIEVWADRLSGDAPRAVMLMDSERRLDRLISHFLIASVRMRLLRPVA